MIATAPITTGGDLAQAGVVWLGTSFAFTTRHFALANIVFIILWLVVTVSLVRNVPGLAPAIRREQS
jgi:hypothetical protein